MAYPTWFNPQYGQQSKTFGGADFTNLLKNRQDAGTMPSYKDLIKYFKANPLTMDQGSNWLNRLEKKEIRHDWGLDMGSPTTAGAEQRESFGDIDLAVAKYMGKSDADVLKYLNENQDKLKGRHKPGGGGLYDKLIASKATGEANERIKDLEGDIEEARTTNKNLKTANTATIRGFSDKIKGLNTQMKGMLTQSDFDTKIAGLTSDWNKRLTEANKLKIHTPSAVGGSSASGVKIKHSPSMTRGTAGMGSRALSRGVRNNMSIQSSLNLA